MGRVRAVAADADGADEEARPRTSVGKRRAREWQRLPWLSSDFINCEQSERHTGGPCVSVWMRTDNVLLSAYVQTIRHLSVLASITGSAEQFCCDEHFNLTLTNEDDMDQVTPGNKRNNGNNGNNANNGSSNNDSISSGKAHEGAVAAATAARVDDMANRAHQTIDRAASGAQPAVDKLAAGAHSAVDRASTSASHAAEGIDSRLDDLHSTGDRLTDQCRDYIEENPLKAVGIALAAGFILSRLI